MNKQYYIVIALAVIVIVMLGLVMRPAPAGPPREGLAPNMTAQTFLQRYVEADGRIRDTGNDDISHSEGQGYGLLFAEAAADRKMFDKILTWTDTHLAVRDDGLYAWNWSPETGQIVDRNNASDGEVLVAWALLRAYDRWGKKAYRIRAGELMDALEAAVVVKAGDRQLLMPGVDGFVRQGQYVLNLSYWVYPAFDRMAREGRPVWRDVSRSGLEITGLGGSGNYRLATDWTQISANKPPRPADGWAPEFGYNAVRIPLHLCWAKFDNAEAEENRLRLIERYKLFWSSYFDFTDRWDVVKDGAAGGAPPTGMTTIASLVLSGCQKAPNVIADNESYYSAALITLSSLAVQDRKNGR